MKRNSAHGPPEILWTDGEVTITSEDVRRAHEQARQASPFLGSLLGSDGDLGLTVEELEGSVDDGWGEQNAEYGKYKGKHVWEYTIETRGLKREGKYTEAITALVGCIDALEEEARKLNVGLAPWYYEQLA